MNKILFICHYSPETLIVGDMVYTWDILHALKHDANNYIHYLTYQDETRWYEKETKKLSALVDKVTIVPFRHMKNWQMGLSLYPASMHNRANGDMLSALRTALKEDTYDVVMVNALRMAYLAPEIRKYGVRSIYLSHNIETEVARSIYKATGNIFQKLIYWQDYVKTAFWEKYLLKYFDAVTAICSYDAKYFVEHNFPGQVEVVRPIVNTTSYGKQKPHTGKLIICGSFTWLPKKINLNRILDSNSIKKLAANGCRLQVVGRTLQNEIDKGNKLPCVEVTGPVDDVHPYYDDAEVAIVPELAGGGFKLKIAEAVRHHLPIVAIKGSITDDNMKAGIHYVEASDFDEVLDKAMELANDRQRQHAIVENATELFRKTYSINAVSKALTRIMNNANKQ